MSTLDAAYELYSMNNLTFFLGMVAGAAIATFIANRNKKKEKTKNYLRDDVSCASTEYESDVESDDTYDEDSKLVLLVRTDLKMGKGKVAAQCAHAAVAAYKAALRHPNILKAWERGGQTKITLKVDSENEMNELSDRASEFGLLTRIIHDAGRTQIAPGSATVCAVGPGTPEVIDVVTGHLKLY